LLQPRHGGRGEALQPRRHHGRRRDPHRRRARGGGGRARAGGGLRRGRRWPDRDGRGPVGAAGHPVASASPSQATTAAPRLRVFVRLKLLLTINRFRGHTWKAVGFAFGLVFGLVTAGLAWLGFFGAAVASAEVGYAVAVLGGAALVIGWVIF